MKQEESSSEVTMTTTSISENWQALTISATMVTSTHSEIKILINDVVAESRTEQFLILDTLNPSNRLEFGTILAV